MGIKIRIYNRAQAEDIIKQAEGIGAKNTLRTNRYLSLVERNDIPLDVLVLESHSFIPTFSIEEEIQEVRDIVLTANSHIYCNDVIDYSSYRILRRTQDYVVYAPVYNKDNETIEMV